MKSPLLFTCALMLGTAVHAQEGVPDTSFGGQGNGRVVFGFDIGNVTAGAPGCHRMQ